MIEALPGLNGESDPSGSAITWVSDRGRFDGVLAELESAGTWARPMRLVDTAGIVIPVPRRG